MVLNSMELHALARTAASGLLNSVLAGIGMAGVAWLVCKVVGRNSARTRFLVWVITFIAMAFLPLVGSIAATSYAMGPTGAAGMLTLPGELAWYLVVGWMVGALAGVFHIGHGLYRLRRLRATCLAVPLEQLDPALGATLEEIQLRRSVTFCISEAVRVPAAIGYFRPMVVFPAWALSEIPAAELNAILLHELAHLRRYDDWTNLAQKLVKAVLFFHPAVWFIESRLTLEREMACDDAVLAASYNPRAYAESLVSLAEKSFLRRGVQLAQAAVSQVQQLKMRLAEILRRDRLVSGQGSRFRANATIAFMSLTALIGVYGISRAPQVVSFQSNSLLVAAVPVVSQEGSGVHEPLLQPVSLGYTGHPEQATPAMRRANLPRQRLQHRAAPKRELIIAKTDREIPGTSGVLPPAIHAASRFPLEFIASPVLVVFQGEQLGANGPVFWRVTIIHLTAAQQRAISGEIPKQI
jgi:beta-lactamase regulating signal transducer with metallopeptidase domain